MSPDAYQVIAIVSMAFGLIILSRVVLRQPIRDLPLGECPSCKVALAKENMSDGPCLDQKFYCQPCRRSALCGCDIRYYLEDEIEG